MEDNQEKEPVEETTTEGDEVETTEEVKVTLTKEFKEAIDESVAKVAEAYEKKQKKFRFHGGQEAEAELTEVEKAKEVVTFIKAVTHNDHKSAAEIHNRRAAALGQKAISIAGAAGSDYLVPTVFETDILESFDSYDEVISNSDVKNFNKPGNVFSLNELDTRTVVFYSDEDSTGLTSSQPTYSEPQIAIDDLIGSTDITLDFMEDQEVDIMSDLARQYGEGMAQLLQARLITGNVTKSAVITKGLLVVSGTNDVAIGDSTGGFSSISADDIENAYFSAIAIDHFQNANKTGKWYMSPVTLQKLRANIRTAASGNDILDIFNPVEMQLLGRPVVLSNQFSTPATTVSNPFIVYGDLKRHVKIRRKRGLTMKVNDSGTTAAGRNLNYQLGRELVVSQRIGHQIVLQQGLTRLVT